MAGGSRRAPARGGHHHGHKTRIKEAVPARHHRGCGPQGPPVAPPPGRKLTAETANRHDRQSETWDVGRHRRPTSSPSSRQRLASRPCPSSSSVVARIASKKIWSDFDPSSLAPGSLNSTAAAAAALAGGDLSDISGLSNEIAAATINQGWSTTGNYWGWSFWVFVGATGLAILGWPLLCFALCCSVGRPRRPYRERGPYSH